MTSLSTPRRQFLYSAALGLVSFSASATPVQFRAGVGEKELFYRYPALSDELVSAVVGAAHARFETVRELVSARPELANATWDWGFGDIESALGAAAHMGRRDIAEFLIEKGARPNIFVFTMLGELEVVEAMVKASPGLQQTLGPHGITLLEHAQSRLRYPDISEQERLKVERMVSYLESLGDAHQPDPNLPITTEEQLVYIGDYRWGEEPDEAFYVSLNRRNLLQIGRQGTFGRALNRVDTHAFTPDGASSVRIEFSVEGGKATSVSVVEHNFTLTAQRE